MIFLAIIALSICHYLADFTHLSTPYMLRAKRLGSPLFPIFIHACVHGLLMFIALLILLGFNIAICYVIIIQIISHFSVDLLKGKLNARFPSIQNPANTIHWYIFGADQLAHQMIILLMIYILASI